MERLVATVIRDFAVQHPARRANVLRAGGRLKGGAGVEEEPSEYTGKCKRSRKASNGKCGPGMEPYQRPTEDGEFEACCMRLALDGLKTTEKINQLNIKKDAMLMRLGQYRQLQQAGDYTQIHTVIKGQHVKRYRFTPKTLALKIASVEAKLARVQTLVEEATPLRATPNQMRDLREDIDASVDKTTSGTIMTLLSAAGTTVLGCFTKAFSSWTDFGYMAVSAIVVGAVVMNCGGSMDVSNWTKKIGDWFTKGNFTTLASGLWTTTKFVATAGLMYTAKRALDGIGNRAGVKNASYNIANLFPPARAMMTAGGREDALHSSLKLTDRWTDQELEGRANADAILSEQRRDKGSTHNAGVEIVSEVLAEAQNGPRQQRRDKGVDATASWRGGKGSRQEHCDTLQRQRVIFAAVDHSTRGQVHCSACQSRVGQRPTRGQSTLRHVRRRRDLVVHCGAHCAAHAKTPE